jgi:mRNA interferase RelE/StbE
MQIIYDAKAIDFLTTLEKSVRRRIFEKIESAKDNPFHFFERLAGRTDYKLRIGDYRAIADIGPDQIRITMIGHRKNIYS